MRDGENIAPALSEAEPSPALTVTNARRWTIVWLLFAASLINYFDRQTLSYALPLLAKDFSLDPVQQGVLSSAFFWSYALMQIPLGSGGWYQPQGPYGPWPRGLPVLPAQ